MAGRKSAGPWWNAERGKWFVWHAGRKVNLKTADEREAVRQWHRLMAGDSPITDTPTVKAIPTVNALSVTQLADAFLADAEGRMTVACRRNYTLFLAALTDKHGDKGAETLTVDDVEGVSRKAEWSTTYRSNFIGCILTVYRWASKVKRIGVNPVADMRKPAKESRGAEAVVSEDDHQKLLAHADPLFADFLRLLWLTGARPGELTSVTDLAP